MNVAVMGRRCASRAGTRATVWTHPGLRYPLAVVTSEGVAERVLRLVAIARGLEDDGAYNAAKLLRAAAASELVRATHEHPRPGPELLRAMEDAIAELRRIGTDAELLALMERALAAVRSGTDRFEGERTRVQVCRRCGEIFLGDLPPRCPTCGIGRLSVEEILPIYFLDPVEVGELVAQLRATPAAVAGLCHGLSEEQARRGEWPPRDVVSHLLGAERLIVGRAVRTLEEEDPEFRAVLPSEVVERGEPAFRELLERLREARERSVARFAALRPEEWRRTGRHPQWGRITLQQQLSYLARHEHSHLGDLDTAARAARGSR